MRRRIPIGIEFYKEMIDKNYYYADKTLLIKEILDSGIKVGLFTRPRRFGKTLTLSMLKTFFEDERDLDGGKIDNSIYFEGMKIISCGRDYMEKQGQYPVINLTLKWHTKFCGITSRKNFADTGIFLKGMYCRKMKTRNTGK